jgi:hypothetical protein
MRTFVNLINNIHLMLRSARRARLEALTASLQLTFSLAIAGDDDPARRQDP